MSASRLRPVVSVSRLYPLKSGGVGASIRWCSHPRAGIILPYELLRYGYVYPRVILWSCRYMTVVKHLFQIQFPTKNFLAKFLIKMHRFWLIYRKLNSKDFFRPLVVLNLFKIRFPSKNFLAKFFIKMHSFRLIHQKLNWNCLFWPLIATHLFKIQFPTKNFLAKFFINKRYGPQICQKQLWIAIITKSRE